MPTFLTVLLSTLALVLARPDLAPPPPRPQTPPPANGAAPALFETADRCMACHNGVVTPAGEDVSIGYAWRATMMANSARDPYWQAAVRREISDHPEAAGAIEDKCSTCHMPMARYEAHLTGATGQVFGNLPVGAGVARGAVLAADGVSCTACHQIGPEGLGQPESFTGGFRVDEGTAWGERTVYGPFRTDAGRQAIMRSATGFRPTEASHVQRAELCATCHTLYTHALDENGEEVGQLPEQMPYLEWRHSAFRNERSCQDCHMPVVETPVAVTGVLGQPREAVNRHVFRGGNFLVLGMLNRYRDELGVTALSQELDAAVKRTVEHLRTLAATVSLEEVSVEGEALRAEVVVTNLAGHKLPTAYPSRRAWLHVKVTDGMGRSVFESGALEPDGSVRGNDNDADPRRFEPHHPGIDGPDQVQIYEAVMVDPRGGVTTGLVSGVRYVKDNRLLPRGFDKTTAAPDVAVRGQALSDPDFTGGSDRVRYTVHLAGARGPFTVEAELWYQPIGFRWARNLEGYDAMETRRFVRYYREMSEASAVRVAGARVVAEVEEVGRR